MKQSKILMTGITGFIGPCLAQYFAKQGAEVHGIVRKKIMRNPQQLRLLKGIQIHWIDDVASELKELVKTIKPDVCFHLATLFKSGHSYEDIPKMIESNLAFGTLLAEALVLAGVPYLINAGTAWQHYNGEVYSPVCLYAAMKQAFEDILKFYSEIYPFQILNLKLFDTYGPDDPRRKLIPLLKECAMTGKEFFTTDGKQFIDLVFIDDVVAGFQQAWEILKKRGQPMESFFLSSGRPIQIRELIEIYQKVAGQNIKIKWQAYPDRLREMNHPWQVSEILPGWQAKVLLEEGLLRI